MRNTKRFLSLLLALLTVAFMGLLGGCSSAGTATNTGLEIPSQNDYERDTRTNAYADYIVHNGLNVQEGEQINVYAPVQAYPLVDQVTKKCYALGASAVNVQYVDSNLERAAANALFQKGFDKYDFTASAQRKMIFGSEGEYESLYIVSPLPTLEVVSTEAQQQYEIASREYCQRVLKNTDTAASGQRNKWSVAVYPNMDWARQVYPDLGNEEALSALWKDIYSALYMTRDATDTNAAADHFDQLDKRAAEVTAMNIRALHITNSQTDLTVGLHQPNVFQGPSASEDGVRYLPNIICEECFAMPEKTNVNGYAAASRPLVLSDGSVVNNLRVTFKDGMLTDWSADSGTEALGSILEEENAKYLGEVSIVSSKSPLFESGRVFYNTLLDENSACHLAFGQAYAQYNLPAGTEPDDEVNNSPIHVDFMIGTPDTKIVAIMSDGTEKVIFENGDWTI